MIVVAVVIRYDITHITHTHTYILYRCMCGVLYGILARCAEVLI